MGDVVKVKKWAYDPEVLIERMHMTRRRRKVYVALEDLDLIFDERDLPEIIRMWEDGLALTDIARSFKRDPDEITCLIMSLARENRIRPRIVGAYGRRRR
ncbi:helix-turn-helix domain-containing protein [Polycladomyces sp. WAk]|uniref:Helix-turn-helix domain-containing protein n=1 Tax=Polycladomyces zharkentensis TaxID=2807616 RepID=A0ABS2WHW2_9BACL|nr:helix-turn-helix domain-containing protein [Polycladomyces sp. WAk]MBN2909137.1 helix-turn-helix domain-containing protein [Polycladomyces sp. WAk]